MRNRLWLILILLLIWCGFSNNFQLPNLLLGLAISVLIPYLVIPRPLHFHINILQLLLLGLHIVVELFRSSIEVAWDVITPTSKSQPEFIEFPLQCQHPVQISLLTNLISLTPGTLAVDLVADDSILVIHIMFAQRQQQFIDFIQKKLEPRVIKVIQHD